MKTAFLKLNLLLYMFLNKLSSQRKCDSVLANAPLVWGWNDWAAAHPDLSLAFDWRDTHLGLEKQSSKKALSLRQQGDINIIS